MNSSDVRVLIVDDDDDFRGLLKLLIERLGCESVMTTDTAASGIAKVEAGIVDLIICDWNMPQMSGLEMLRAVRQTGKFRRIPFLMLTSEATKDKVIEASKEGVTDYIIKTADRLAIINKLKQYVNPDS